ncbi:MAG: hypothetical protein LBB24_01625 [Rickettsiales bacterium]|jgi:hypothetical protein|nr:hypothetical protein [Rickettsiales bacterium]
MGEENLKDNTGSKIKSREEFEKIFRGELEKLCDETKDMRGFYRFSDFADFLSESEQELREYYKLDIDIVKEKCVFLLNRVKDVSRLRKVIEGVCGKDDTTTKAEKIIKDCESYNDLRDKMEQSQNKEDFVKNVRDFVKEFRDSDFLPLASNDRKRNDVALWTNWGLKDISENEEYSQYIDDNSSCLFSHLWFITRMYIDDENFKESAFFNELREECEGQGHIPYDKILSEIFVESIDENKLGNVRIEYGQNRDVPKEEDVINARNVFFNNELPVFLAGSAKYNANMRRLDAEGEQTPEEKNLVSMEKALAVRIGEKKDGGGVVPVFYGPGEFEHGSSKKYDLNLQTDVLEPMEDIASHLILHRNTTKSTKAVTKEKIAGIPGLKQRTPDGTTKTAKTNSEIEEPAQFRSEMMANILIGRKKKRVGDVWADELSADEARRFIQERIPEEVRKRREEEAEKKKNETVAALQKANAAEQQNNSIADANPSSITPGKTRGPINLSPGI